MDTALIIGATGLVGGCCLSKLLASEDYRSVIALTRRRRSTYSIRAWLR